MFLHCHKKGVFHGVYVNNIKYNHENLTYFQILFPLYGWGGEHLQISCRADALA